MLLPAAVNEIKRYFMTGWALVGGGVPYVFDNDTQDEGVPSYLRVSVATTRRFGYTQGDKIKYRQEGRVDVKCYSPIAGGATAGLTLAQLVMTLFEGEQFGSVPSDVVTCAEASPIPLGSDGRYWITLVRVSAWWLDVH